MGYKGLKRFNAWKNSRGGNKMKQVLPFVLLLLVFLLGCSADKTQSELPVYSVNETISTENFEFTLSKVQFTNVFDGSYDRYRTDNQFVILQITIKNTRDSPYYFTLNDLKLVDEKQTYSYGNFYLGNDLVDKTTKSIAPSFVVNGNIVYEVPKESSDFWLVKEGLFKIKIEK